MPNAPLELSTIAPERDRARLRTETNPEGLRPDGSEYELTNPEDLSIVELQDVFRHAAEMQKLVSGEKLSKDDQVRIERIMNAQCVRLIRDADPKDVADLPGVTKQRLVTGFLAEVTEAMAPEKLREMLEQIAAKALAA